MKKIYSGSLNVRQGMSLRISRLNAETTKQQNHEKYWLPLSRAKGLMGGDPVHEVELKIMSDTLRRRVDILPGKQRIVIRGLFIEEKSPEELATTLRVTPVRVGQIKADGLKNLRNIMALKEFSK